jgi:2-polyprenyl-3-methyl-5-hydroxy-6-metoxy-1,4-benzoquinol methylase
MLLGKVFSPYDLERVKCVVSLIPLSQSTAYALDLGCGDGMIGKTITKKGYVYIGLDISRTAILKGKNSQTKSSNIHFLRGDVNHLPFKPRFKLVVALEIIEHLENPCKLLVEINNVLSEDGYLVISTPNRVSLEGLKGKAQEFVLGKRWTAWNTGHKHIFSSFEFLRLLAADLSITKVLGYYFLPEVSSGSPASARVGSLGRHLRFLKTHKWPLNLFGFQTIAVLNKTRTK